MERPREAISTDHLHQGQMKNNIRTSNKPPLDEITRKLADRNNQNRAESRSRQTVSWVSRQHINREPLTPSNSQPTTTTTTAQGQQPAIPPLKLSLSQSSGMQIAKIKTPPSDNPSNNNSHQRPSACVKQANTPSTIKTNNPRQAAPSSGRNDESSAAASVAAGSSTIQQQAKKSKDDKTSTSRVITV